MNNQVFISLWNKYKPAVIQMMVASQNGPQQYQLYPHEFKVLSMKEKSYSFTMRAFKGKALNRTHATANSLDLLMVLNDSKKATELMSENEFDFTLDKQYVLHVARVSPA